MLLAARRVRGSRAATLFTYPRPLPALSPRAHNRYYGRRYVGELSLLEPARTTLRFSVLDVWGNREDVDVPLAAVAPPFRNMPTKVANHIANQLLFPVNAEVPGGGRRQFYVSVVAGELLDGPTFLQLLKGEYVPPSAASTRNGSNGVAGGSGSSSISTGARSAGGVST